MEERITRIKAGSAVKVTDETRDTLDALFTPNGGVVYDIFDPDGTKKVDAAVMTESSTGMWASTSQTEVSWVLGMYTLIVRATHGSMVSIKENKNAFELY